METAVSLQIADIGGQLVLHDSEDAWHRARLAGISGSDAGKIASANKYGSMYELWCEKTGRIVYVPASEDERMEQNEAAHWGVILEPIIREEFTRRTGLHVHCDPRWSIRRHPDLPWMIGTPDGYVWDPERGWGIWECKTAGAYLRDQWDDAVPPSYFMQVMHYMAVTGLGYAIIVVLIGGQKYKQYTVERDDVFIDLMMKAETEFRRCVVEDRVPMIDGHPATARALQTIYPTDTGASIELPAAAIAWDEQRMQAIADLESATESRGKAENLLKESIGNASFGILPNGVRYSWKGSPTRRLLRLKQKDT